MNIFKRFFSESTRPIDWYFVVHTDGFVRPAYWNGVVFENRVEVIAPSKIFRVMGRVPHDQEKYQEIIRRWDVSRNDPRLALFPQGRVQYVDFRSKKA